MSASVDWDALIAAASRVRERAYAPYSRYLVGAALLADDGQTFVGANVENASYGLCLCAERSAIGSAIAAGARRFTAIAVVTGGEQPGTPCGMCRQVLAEFAPALEVRCVAESGASIVTTIEALLPLAFTPAALGIDPVSTGPRSTLVMGTTDRRALDRTDPRGQGAFGAVALKVAAGTGTELAGADVTQIDGDADERRK